MNTLYEDILEATKKAIKELSKNDDIYAFAIVTDQNYDTLRIAANTKRHLKSVEKLDAEELYKFDSNEWDSDYENIAKNEFEKIEKKINGSSINNDKEFEKFEQNFQETCLNVLKELKFSGEFDKHFKHPIFITFTITDYEFKRNKIRDFIVILNHNNKYKDEFLKWMET